MQGKKGYRTMGGWSLKSKNFVEDHSKEVVLEQLDHEEYEINEKAAAVNKAISNLNEPIILNGRASFLPTSLSPLKIPTNREIDLDAFRVQGVSGKKSFINASELFRLEKTGLGAALGWGFMVNRLTEESWSYKAEIQFSGNFSNNFQFRVGLGQLKVGYFSEQMDDAIGVPDLSPPSETFKFVGAEVNQVRMEYTLGLNYLITTKQKWRPFVGIAYANKFATTYRVGYKFEDLTSDQNWELASEVEGKRIPGAAIILKAGLEYEIGKKLMMQIQGDLRRGLKSKDLELPALVMVQAGLNYRF